MTLMQSLRGAGSTAVPSGLIEKPGFLDKELVRTPVTWGYCQGFPEYPGFLNRIIQLRCLNGGRSCAWHFGSLEYLRRAAAVVSD